ncbi:hypothetical protein INS49_010111 [Diaporthe citri]|uniref:uncharacterized protein n=1 Tax=Diaporthe citri TaxID=83186 RepID=UPI001C7FAA1D|nr:uncharacterized protein INS49_010111 [Diaporthe citri]KAG6361882.1 hypothetical protein INS49_010111 [Diaporthe citri]
MSHNDARIRPSRHEDGISELPVNGSKVELSETSTKGHEMAGKYTALINHRLAIILVTQLVTLYFTSKWQRLNNSSFVKPMSGVGQSYPISGSSPTEILF